MKDSDATRSQGVTERVNMPGNNLFVLNTCLYQAAALRCPQLVAACEAPGSCLSKLLVLQVPVAKLMFD